MSRTTAKMNGREFTHASTTGEWLMIRTHERGLLTALGPLEALVLDMLWRAARPLPIRTVKHLVHEEIARRNTKDKTSHKPPALTTVQTTLHRLGEKGLVLVDRQAGSPILYSTILTREEFARWAGTQIAEAYISLVGPLVAQEQLEQALRQRAVEWIRHDEAAMRQEIEAT